MIHAAHSILFAAALLASSVTAGAQTIERLSVSTTGVAANQSVEAVTRVSDDGRYAAFSTTATNLVSPDPTLTRDVFLRDRLLGTTTRVRTEANVGDLTSDGRLLSYSRQSTAVAAVVDLATDAEFALSTPPILSTPGPFSADGRFLLYQRGDAGTGGLREVVRREIATALDDLVSVTFNGGSNTILAIPGHLSPDGSIATFTTADPEMVPGDGNGRTDAFYKDHVFGFTDRISVDGAGAELAGDSIAGSMTTDTRYFLYSSISPALQDDTNGDWDLYVADRYLGELRRASISSSGMEGNGPTQSPNAWISADGSRVVFESNASNLVDGDTNNARDVFERDFVAGTTRRLVVGIGGVQPDADVRLRTVSTDGRYLTIVSAAANLVAGPSNGELQAYLVDRGPQCSIVNYCMALPNSTGVPAVLQSTGSPSASLNNFVLSALDVPEGSACVFFHGTSRLEPAVPFGDGLRCVGGTVKRLGALQSSGGAVIQFQDSSSLPYANVQPGDVRRFQMLYRDSVPGGAGFNTTAALEVTFCP